MSDRLTIRLGNLAGALLAAAQASGKTISQEARDRLAKSLGVESPDMPQGFAAMSEKQADKLRRKAARVKKSNRADSEKARGE